MNTITYEHKAPSRTEQVLDELFKLAMSKPNDWVEADNKIEAIKLYLKWEANKPEPKTIYKDTVIRNKEVNQMMNQILKEMETI